MTINKKSKKIFFFVLIFCVFGVVGKTMAAVLTLSPSSSALEAGTLLNIDIILDTQLQPIDGIDINALNYDPVFLELQDQNLLVSGAQILPGSLMSATIYNNANISTGKIVFSQITAGGQTFNGQGVLASVKFKASKAGQTN